MLPRQLVRRVPIRTQYGSKQPMSRMFTTAKEVNTHAKQLRNFPQRKTNTIFNMCQQGHTAVITRFGRLHGTREPGWYMTIPFFDRIHNVDQRELTISIDPQIATTKDNVSVAIGGSLFVQVTDPLKACFGATQPLYLAEQQAQAIMRSGIGKVSLDELFHDRASLNTILRGHMQNSADEWGLLIKRYELTTVRPDDSVSHAMDKQAVAERTRREDILKAEAEKRSMVLVSEGRRQELINEAEGHKIERILAAEAQKEEAIRVAEGQAAAIELQADAQKAAITAISQAIGDDAGVTAMNYTNAQEYIQMMRETMSQGNKTTLFLPTDVTNVEATIARGMSIIGNMDKTELK